MSLQIFQFKNAEMNGTFCTHNFFSISIRIYFAQIKLNGKVEHGCLRKHVQ